MRGFLLDENLPKSLPFIESSMHVTDLGKRKTDTEIWQYAKNNDFVIITKDTDFYDRIILEGSPPKVIWIRLGNLRREKMEDLIHKKWDEIKILIGNYSLIEIHPDRIEGVK